MGRQRRRGGGGRGLPLHHKPTWASSAPPTRPGERHLLLSCSRWTEEWHGIGKEKKWPRQQFSVLPRRVSPRPGLPAECSTGPCSVLGGAAREHQDVFLSSLGGHRSRGTPPSALPMPQGWEGAGEKQAKPPLLLPSHTHTHTHVHPPQQFEPLLAWRQWRRHHGRAAARHVGTPPSSPTPPTHSTTHPLTPSSPPTTHTGGAQLPRAPPPASALLVPCPRYSLQRQASPSSPSSAHPPTHPTARRCTPPPPPARPAAGSRPLRTNSSNSSSASPPPPPPTTIG